MVSDDVVSYLQVSGWWGFAVDRDEARSNLRFALGQVLHLTDHMSLTRVSVYRNQNVIQTQRAQRNLRVRLKSDVRKNRWIWSVLTSKQSVT